MFNLQQKTAVITGGGSGIGKAIAERFAKQGASVFILELDVEAAQKAVDSIVQNGGKAHAYSCNVSNQENVKQVFANIVKEAHQIDILINSAGIAHIGNIGNTEEADLDRIYQVNIKGVYNTMRNALGYMKE